MRSTPDSHELHRRVVRRRWSWIGALSAVVLLVGACQAGADQTPPPPGASVTGAWSASADPSASPRAVPVSSPVVIVVPASTTPAAVDPRADGLDIAVSDTAITVEAPVIRPGRVTLIVHNTGHRAHRLEMKPHGSGSGGDRRRIETRAFRPGETLRVEADLVAGSYEIEDSLADDSSDVRGSLEVRTDAPWPRTSPGAATPGAVRIVQFAFVAAAIDVSVGTRVTWTNDDPAPHTVTADDGTFDSRQLDPGSRSSVVFTRAGTFTYHCDIHPTMVGTVAVH